MAVRLSKRMTALAALVTEGHRLADIGTDHGYLPIYLCQTGRIPSAIAMDVRKGPLQQANAHISQQNLTGQIQTRLSDGLRELRAGEADTILIAGMGGGLVIRILTEGAAVLTGEEELILQPQSEIYEVRAFVRAQGWEITDERMICEDGKYYPMMRVLQHRITDGESAKAEEILLADHFGPVLLKRRDPILREWLQLQLKAAARVLAQLEAQEKNERILGRMQEVENNRELLIQALSRY